VATAKGHEPWHLSRASTPDTLVTPRTGLATAGDIEKLHEVALLRMCSLYPRACDIRSFSNKGAPPGPRSRRIRSAVWTRWEESLGGSLA